MKKTFKLIGVIILCVLITGCKKKDINYTKMKDTEFLSAINVWQNDIAYKTKYTFNEDKTGEYTSNSKDYQKYKWSLTDEGLFLTYDNGIEETLSIKIDKKNIVIKITNSSGSVQTFRKDGTYKSEMIKEQKDEELYGVWISTNDRSRCLILNEKTSGRAFLKNKQAILSDEIVWNTKDNMLYIESETGILSVYSYIVKNKELSLYLDGTKIQSYFLSNVKYKIKRAN